RVVRALHPHIGARVELPDGRLLGVLEAAVARGDEAEPGARGVIVADGRLLLACSEGALQLLVVQPAGGRPMTGEAYLRGHGLATRR
ncbi:MAG TPA: methionyl-tRNA formyltransferase, partial [Solirubrobacteraceae bacterium]|nr:methionyl-tRNA formyltransferase [Solirubrobacteraceae bacterium]